jgi:hypothetical protein
MKEIPVLRWTQIGTSFFAWIDGTTLYSLKPVVYVDNGGERLQWELRIVCPQAGSVELIGVYDKDVMAKAYARSHVGDDE